MKKCLVCEKDVNTDTWHVYNATIWKTHGNYGSSVYDPMSENTYLEAVVCDECLKKKRKLMEEVVSRKKVVVVKRREPIFDDQDHPEHREPESPSRN